MAKINCPNCKKVLFYKNRRDMPNFPFCSERCKLVDLGAWLNEEYRIEEPVSPDALCKTERKGGENG